jgi:hypothetical protein
VFFATDEGEPNAIEGVGLLSGPRLSADAPNAELEEEEPNKLVAGGPNGFEPVDDEEPKEKGSFVG